MAFNKRILDKIENRCGDDDNMLDFFHEIVTFEFGDSKQYTKEYEKRIREFAKKARDDAR